MQSSAAQLGHIRLTSGLYRLESLYCIYSYCVLGTVLTAEARQEQAARIFSSHRGQYPSSFPDLSMSLFLCGGCLVSLFHLLGHVQSDAAGRACKRGSRREWQAVIIVGPGASLAFSRPCSLGSEWMHPLLVCTNISC
jgi:hypothetical protein